MSELSQLRQQPVLGTQFTQDGKGLGLSVLPLLLVQVLHTMSA